MTAVDAASRAAGAERSAQPISQSPAAERWIDLAKVIGRLAGARELDSVVDIVRESARRLIGADGIAFVLREDELCHYVAEDAIAPLWAGRRFPLASCVSGWAMEQGRTAVIPDVYADSRVPHEHYRPTFVKSMVMAPVAGEPGEACIAALAAYWAEPRSPQPEEVALLEALAHSSATAIANTRLLASLQASDALQRAIVASTPECIKIVAEDGRLLQMNPAGLRMVQAPDAESVNQARTHDLIAAEHRERWDAMHKRVCAGEHLSWEFDIIGLAGARRSMETHAVPLKLPDGSTAQLAVTREVTERRRSETALRLERDRSRAVLDNMGDGYVLVDQSFQVLEINPAGLAIEGRPAEEIVGKSFWEAWPGVEEGEAGRLWKEAMAQRAPRTFEHRYVWPNGRAAWLELRAFPADSGLAFFFRDVSERKAGEAALAEREAHLSAIFAQAAAGMSETDASGRFVRVNDRFCQITGRSRQELLSLRMHDITHPDDLTGNAPKFDRTASVGEAFEIEKRYVRPDGSTVWVHNSVTALRADDGQVRNIVCVTVDVEARKAAEEALKQNEARLQNERTRYQSLVEATASVVWSADAHGAFVKPQASWEAYTGQGWPEHQAFGWTRMLHPEDRERVAAEWKAAVESGQRYSTDGRLWRAQSGAYHDFIARAAPIRDGAGSIVEWVGAITDIHRQRRAERELAELAATLEHPVAEALAERSLLADIIDGTDVFVQVADCDYNWLAINKASAAEFARMFGVPRPKAGDNMLELLKDRPADQAAIKSVWARALAGEEFVQVDAFGDPTLDRRYYEMHFRTLRDSEGRVLGAYQFVYEVTERLKEQARLQEAEAALRQSQKMEAMGQLTGGVAHDFNNLLTPIVGSLDLLQRRQVGGEREQRLIDGALQSADRAKTLVQRLLAFARRQPLQATAVDVGKLVTGMADLLASTTGPQIRLSVDIEEDLPAAEADPNQLEMALLNLGVNARDAMPKGGTLHVTARAETIGSDHRSKLPPGRYVHLAVADTGVGMDEATLARAVEPFFSTKGVGKGTGLGLSMVHGLALQLGGALTIQSRPGAGTTIELWLPASDRPAETAARLSGPSSAPVRRGTALLVDDEQLVRMSTADMLIELGYTVVEASSGEEALRLLQEGLSPDLLVTDHLMPGMNGTDLARAVRAEQPRVQVLIVSGYAEAEGVDPDLPRLIKPFRNADLAAQLEAAFAG